MVPSNLLITIDMHRISTRAAMIRVTLSGGKILFVGALLLVLAYGGFRIYKDVVADYVEEHPAGQEFRPDVSGP